MSEQFTPEPMPPDLQTYRERMWYELQFTRHDVKELNGKVTQHEKRLLIVEDDTKTAKIWGRASAALLGVAGTIFGVIKMLAYLAGYNPKG